MRPQRLVVQAFGPYRAQETVDFSELGANRVFLIHGDTGAGKTTILDAMVFALYGETSGGERRADQMRCDSSPDALATEVVFDFELGERSYRIRRRPTQRLAGSRSGGSLVTKQAEVALWDRTGCSPDDEGKPLALKIREADACMRELLGFSCEQFRQVVVLPQGRFRELLSAGSDKREEILRQLFRTERFRELEMRLADRAKQVRKEMEQLELRRRAQLDLVAAADGSELNALIHAATGAVEAGSVEAEEADRVARSLETELQAARQGVDAFQALAVAQAHVAEVEGRGEAIDGLRERLAALLRADEVQPVAAAHAEEGARLQQALAEQRKAEMALLEARGAEQAAAERLAAENVREPERLAAEDRTRDLERHAVALAGWREAAGERGVAAARLTQADEAAGQARAALQNVGREVAELETLVQSGKSAALRLEIGRERLARALRLEEQCRRLADIRARKGTAVIEHYALEQAEAGSLQAHRDADARVDAVEGQWKAGRAATLAATLVPGEPCPVCGSADHPAPAGTGAVGVADEDLEDARVLAAEARESYDRDREMTADARNRLTALAVQETSLLQEAGDGAEAGLGEVCAEVGSWKAEVAALEVQVEAGQVEESLAAAMERRTEVERAGEGAAAAYAAAAQDLAGAEARLAERSRGIPEEFRADGALDAALTQARRMVETLRAALAEAAEEAASSKELRISRQAALEAATVAAHAAVARETTAQESLAAALQARGFVDEEDRRRHLGAEGERGGLEQRIAGHQDDVQLARGRLQQAEKAVEGQCLPADVEGLETRAKEARERLEAAFAARAEAGARLGSLQGVRAGLEALDRESEDVRADYGVVGMLADTAGGQNVSRVSFQRWVLGVYLDEVLIAAGRKLYGMSKGRYRFQREREAQSRRRPSGLDIAVFDEFSGVARPAVTLSGGESFLAALALALGLAETVQEHAAGTPLETIFVDEGFGSLDPDALELAVDALMELQMSGRLVGVISHVAELKQVIPARLEVRGGSGGSSARFIVP